MKKKYRKDSNGGARLTINFYENLLRASTDGILITDATHNIIEANEAFCNFFERQRHEFIATNLLSWLEQLGADCPGSWTEMVNCVHRKGHCRFVEFKTTTQTRGTTYYRVNASLIEQVDCKEAGLILSIWRDITELKKKEDALYQTKVSEEQIHLTNFVKDIGIALTHGNTLHDILLSCSEVIVSSLQAAFARIWTHSVEEDVLELQASAGIYTHIDGPHSRIPVGKFKIGRIAQERKPHLTNSVIDDPNVSDKEWARREGIVAFAGYPLVAEAHLIGVIAMFARKPLTNYTLRMLASVADVIALGIVHKQREEELKKSENRFRTIFDNANDGIIVADTETKKFYTGNQKICQVLGYTSEEIKNLSIVDIHPAENLPALIKLFEKHSKGEYAPAEDVPVKRKDGSVFFADINSSLITFGGKTYLMGIFRDVTERRQIEEKMRRMAFHDPLTSLPNRVLFNDRLALALAHARRNKEMLAVLFLDLDRFKVINDTLGHTVGDQLLQAVAGRLKDCVREDDTVARLSGDEFSLLLPGITHVEDVDIIARKIIHKLKQPWVVGGHELYITASIGIVLYPHDGKDAETLLRNADTTMYHVKEQEKNNYRFYTSNMHVETFEKMILERDIHRALERKEFTVYYQPIVNITTGRLVGTEALIRWQHPDRGLILPDEFLPMAEDTRLIVPIDELILRIACLQNKTWQDSGLQSGYVAVNLSVYTFQQPNLVETIASILQETGLNPHLLGLEITEGISMQDIGTTVYKLNKLKELGIHIAIDDFGTGFSSLQYLKRFPIDRLKISPLFVSDMITNRKDKMIVSSIIALSQGLQFSVIAEGVETIEQLLLLKQFKCDAVQGNFLCKPLPSDEFKKMMLQDKTCISDWNRNSDDDIIPFSERGNRSK